MFILSHTTAFEYWRQTAAFPSRRLCFDASANRLSPADPRMELESEPISRLENFTDTLSKMGLDLQSLTQPYHLLNVNIAAERGRSEFRLHRGHRYLQQEGPRLPFVKIGPGLFACTPEVCLLQLASLLDVINLALAGCELCSSFRHVPERPEKLEEIQPLIKKGAIEQLLLSQPYAPGLRKARRATRFVLPNAASPAEIALHLYLGLPRMLGGHGLLPAALNHPIELGRYSGVLTNKSKLVADLYWPRAKLDVEYKSTEFHLSRKAMTEDAEREAALGCLGVQVIDVTWEQLRSIKSMERTARGVSRHLGKRFSPKSAEQITAELYMRTKLLHYLRTLRFEQPGLYGDDGCR